MREKLIQKKLTETWSLLPEREKSKFRSEKEKKRRMELKEVKENLWRWTMEGKGKVQKIMHDII